MILKEINERSFINATQLQNIVIPSSITHICNRAFNNCTKLKNILFASPSSLEFIDDFAFSNCKSLQQITIPKSVTKIGKLAFSECFELRQVLFETPSSLNTIGDEPFNHCNKLIQFININPCFTPVQLIGKIHVTIMHITIKDKFEMDLEPDKLIEDLRQEICHHYDNKYELSRLKLSVLDEHNGRIFLTEGTKLLDYDIHEGSNIFLSTHAYRGG